jgi:hypothetical protein
MRLQPEKNDANRLSEVKKGGYQGTDSGALERRFLPFL